MAVILISTDVYDSISLFALDLRRYQTLTQRSIFDKLHRRWFILAVYIYWYRVKYLTPHSCELLWYQLLLMFPCRFSGFHPSYFRYWRTFTKGCWSPHQLYTVNTRALHALQRHCPGLHGRWRRRKERCSGYDWRVRWASGDGMGEEGREGKGGSVFILSGVRWYLVFCVRCKSRGSNGSRISVPATMQIWRSVVADVWLIISIL